jgi:FtsP/CotA-like multicopper oxidase with cupredoxin domain
MSRPSSAGDRSFTSTVAAFVATGAFLLSALAIVVVSTYEPSTSTSAVAAQAPVAVKLSEFAISPATISAGTGELTLAISNVGTQTHNIEVKGLNKKSPDIPAGGSATLDLGKVPAGTYTVVCLIPGHEAAGMTGSLVVTEGGGAAPAADSDTAMAGMDHSAMSDADYAAMDAKMAEGMAAGLETFTKGGATEGKGNQKLAPEVLPDGTKRFNIEASIVDWETEPGKVVKAWAYNGMVPGPWIRIEPNDKVEIVLKNSLPVSTDMHSHGITTPFEMDGVAPLTQPAIKPGETFTYAFTAADHNEMGMYHAHDHGNVAVVNGLFAVFQVGDMPLPRGETINNMTVPADMTLDQELVMVTNDAGVIGLSLNGKSYPATEPVVADPGDWILMHYYNEGLQSHPMHLHRVPQLVVAKDGFPLAQPYWVDTLNVAPGERYSVLINPDEDAIGVWAWHCHILSHAENDTGLFGMVTALIVNDPNKAA